MPPPASKPPFGLSPVTPSFDRATRLAKTLFQATESYILLIDGERTWRSRAAVDQSLVPAPMAEHVLRTGQLLWLDDAPLDPRFDPDSFVFGDIRTRFCAAAPVRLCDGSTPGVLAVFDLKPRPFDRSLANRLMDLADGVADECDRARAKEQTERSEQRLRLALELAHVEVMDLDYERQTVELAGAPDTFFERQPTYAELVEDPFWAVDPRDRDIVAQAWKQLMREGVPYRPEYRIKRSDGDEMWARSAARVFTNEAGEITRLVSASQNITDRKQAERILLQAKEEADAANAAKSTFLATMSHEIRTPLNGVLGMAQAMAMDELEPAQRERLDVIRRSGQTLLAILNDVLDLSKIEAGKLELERTTFDVGELVRGVHDVFTPAAEAKGCEFGLVVDPRAAGLYLGDPTRVRQILYNLVSNGLKFTEAGEVQIWVSPCPEGIELQVKDSGIGMSAEHMNGLFRKFEQADASTTRRFGGTGLGLAICRELSSLMGGSIQATSTPGEGSTFTVTLPLPRLGDAPAQAAVEPAPLALSPCQPLRVLAAEDNAVNQLVLKALLQHIGVEPRIAGDGLETVAAWEAEDWDLILMDVQMPRLDGPAATRIIRNGERATGRARTPIIALTANAMAHQVDAYRAAGMDGFVAKPIAVGELFAAIQATLADRQDERAVGAT
jgi:PAS domain S-box-containing protein